VVLLEHVFGVSSKPVLSYVERPDVDERFLEALVSDKEIIVYGSSKQGKTALVSKYLPYKEHILISLTSRMSVLDIYQTLLGKAGVRITTGAIDKRGTETAAGVGARVKALIPLIGGGEASATGSTKASSGSQQTFEEVPVNLELPQQVAGRAVVLGASILAMPLDSTDAELATAAQASLAMAHQEAARARKLENPTLRGPSEATAPRYAALVARLEAAQRKA
jgi:hypothetical protein